VTVSPADAIRDYVALVAAASRGDEEGMAAVTAAQDGDLYPLLEASLTVLDGVLAGAAWPDAGQWAAAVQRRWQEAAARTPGSLRP
jgi:hypothetical protein